MLEAVLQLGHYSTISCHERAGLSLAATINDSVRVESSMEKPIGFWMSVLVAIALPAAINLVIYVSPHTVGITPPPQFEARTVHP